MDGNISSGPMCKDSNWKWESNASLIILCDLSMSWMDDDVAVEAWIQAEINFFFAIRTHFPFHSLIKLPVTGKVHLWQKVCQVSVRHDAYGETPIRNCLRERHANINLHVELIREQLIPVNEMEESLKKSSFFFFCSSTSCRRLIEDAVEPIHAVISNDFIW